MKLINLISGAIALISSVSAFPKSYSRYNCGPDNGNAVCDSGYCCSEYGWCGKSDDHCLLKKGCQPKFGTCKKSELLFSSDRCGEGVGKCYPGYCCSRYGWCGESDEHCSLEKGCQSEFAGKAEWAGFRFSEGAVRKEENYGEIPDGNRWLGFINKFTKYFKGSKPTVIVIVSQNCEDVICKFGFPKPSGVSKTEYIEFSSKDKFEDILKVFDKNGINVWLQVEPGDNDLVTIAKIVFNQYGHHSCVQGFGIDLEWWHKNDTGKGRQLSDDDAERIVRYVRSVNGKYTVFAKHWKIEFMPPNYRDHMIFIDDSNKIGSLEDTTEEFNQWAIEFKNNPVMYQVGYNEDYNLWGKNPISFARAVVEEASNYNDHVGILWVDISMKEALKKM
ncbi:carbohydrate-binding module family 18 protein [Piromyces sp. E2]|nr:carbohydrate-binding module family 18 protein [Piromyces sp. E2]|eukprot:OUM65015.1 carbohydrate-binding module family 18 protein [Piromyces sp. E2]